MCLGNTFSLGEFVHLSTTDASEAAMGKTVITDPPVAAVESPTDRIVAVVRGVLSSGKASARATDPSRTKVNDGPR